MLYMMQIFFLLMMGIGQTTQEQNQFGSTYVSTGILPGTTGNIVITRSKGPRVTKRKSL